MNRKTAVDFTMLSVASGTARSMLTCCCRKKPQGAANIYLKAKKRLYYEIDLL